MSFGLLPYTNACQRNISFLRSAGCVSLYLLTLVCFPFDCSDLTYTTVLHLTVQI